MSCSWPGGGTHDDVESVVCAGTSIRCCWRLRRLCSPLIANFIYVLISFGWLSLATPPPGLPPRRIRHHTHSTSTQHQAASDQTSLDIYYLQHLQYLQLINTIITRISPCVSSARVDNSSALIEDTACMQCCSAAECQ